MNPNYSMYRVHEKIAAMEKFLNLDKFIQGKKNSPAQILSYFRINRWAYRHFHSQDGFMHFRISKNGCFTDEDIYFQPDSVSRFIQPGSVVLELGYGQGANLLYLAHCHPEASFIGVDLQKLKNKDVPSNVSTFCRNYEDLSFCQDNSVDVVYAIETIVHNDPEAKEKVWREVYRVLKPGGVVVVFDYALREPYASYDPVVQKAIATSKGGASAIIESVDELNEHYKNCGLKVEKMTDYTQEALPDLKRLERKATKIMERPWLARLVFWLLPDQFVSNIIIGYLGYDGGNAGYGVYLGWVLRKPSQVSL